jgi:hypothetical protein
MNKLMVFLQMPVWKDDKERSIQTVTKYAVSVVAS